LPNTALAADALAEIDMARKIGRDKITTQIRILAAWCVRVLAKSGLEKTEAQGKPGAQQAPVASHAKWKTHTSVVTTGSPNNPTFPAQWF